MRVGDRRRPWRSVTGDASLSRQGRRLWRGVAGGLAAIAIMAALLVGALRLVLAHVPGYQEEIAGRVRAATGLTLRFDGLDARLGLRGPEIFFDAARVISEDGRHVLLSARAGRVQVALLRSLLHRRLEVARFTLEGPRLGAIVYADGHVEWIGLDALLRPDPAKGPFTLARLPEGSFEIRDGVVDVQDRRAGAVPRLRVEGLDVAMERSGSVVRIGGQLDLPRDLGSSIRWDARAEGDLAGWSALGWRVRAVVGRVDFSHWRRHLPGLPGLPVAGRGSLELGVRGSGRRPTRGELDVDFAEVVLAALPGRASDRYQRLEARAEFTGSRDRWSLDVSRLLLQGPAQTARPMRFRLDGVRQNGRLASLALDSAALWLDDLRPLAALAPASERRDGLVRLAPRGTLHDVSLIATRLGSATPELRGRLRLEGFGFEPVGTAPGIDGLDAVIAATGPGGTAQVDTRRFVFAWPHNFRDRIAARRLALRAGWDRHRGAWRLWADDLELDLDDAKVRARLRMLFQGADPGPLIDLSARVSDARVADAWRYLPVSKFRPAGLGWLDAAFRAGRVREATLALTGPLRRYPFRDGSGLFRVDADIEGLALNYVNGWPLAQDLNLHARFENEGMRARIDGGRVGQLALAGGEVAMVDWREGGMTARLPVAGDLGEAFGLLQSSPLGPTLGDLFMGLSGRGPVQGEVVLYLPLKHMEDRGVTVATRVQGAEVREAGIDEPLTDLGGTLTVRDGAIFAPRLEGRFAGGPVGITIDTAIATPARRLVTVEASGRLDGARLQRFAQLPVNAGLAGETDWRGTMRIERASADENSRVTARLESDLAGLASGLPAPFDKTAAERRPIAIDLEFGPPGHFTAIARHGGLTRAALAFERSARGWQVERGGVRFGPGPDPVVGDEPGLRLSGALPRASLSSVLALRDPGSSGRHVQDWLRAVDLDVDRLEALGFVFERVGVQLRPGTTAWRVQLESADIAGRVAVPFSFTTAEPLALDLDRLHLGATETRAGGGEPVDPRQLPPIHFDVRDFTVDHWQFGHLTAELVRGADGLVANAIEARHAAFLARGQGAWRVQAGGPQTNLTVDVTSADLRGFMRAMGYDPVIAARRTSAHAELHWPGMLDGSFFERMSGTIRLEADEGELLDVEPGGAGRMLGLMSIAHLPRRLALDFRDITGHGLAFDSIRGSFVVTDGDAYTDDLTLRSAAAEIGIVGHTSFRSRTYDQTAMVTGKLGASLGVAGVLAGGPAVGAVMLLFSQVFKSPLKGMTRGYYRITGAWDRPTVERIDADRHRAAQADAAGAASAATPPAPLAQ